MHGYDTKSLQRAIKKRSKKIKSDTILSQFLVDQKIYHDKKIYSLHAFIVESNQR